jgi:hypothetical protein
MNKNYIAPEVEIIKIGNDEDIIRTSLTGSGDNDFDMGEISDQNH